MSSFDPNGTGPGNPTPTEPDEKTKELIARAGREGMVMMVLFAAALLTSLYTLPWRLTAGLFAAAGIIWAIRYAIASTRAKRGGTWLPTVIIAILGCGWCLLGTISNVAFYPMQQELQDCRESALTEQAALGCQTTYDDKLENLMKSLTGQTGWLLRD
ncbi:hypothetical protein NQ036_13345 [Brevibacterium sp. 91QC2O2]|uniref:hypothetical protein n=1 Tax=Brevibacterium sp. 91QC2O2 TaxID=2968458 RepID=UPI00211C79C9|nr:hypothetical protein [Brevibacterium sp. 91QC2O2]MCQ9369222.1 hypothetical protein [Brevibacterium sp. 91QC2O2]